MQDVIALRCNYLLDKNWESEKIFELSIKFTEGIVGISDFTLEDTRAYFPHLFEKRNIPVKRIYHASSRESKIENEDLPFASFCLIFGNSFKHKMLSETVSNIKDTKTNFIILGAKETGKIEKNIFGYKSGNLSNSFINELLEKCTCIIFPSVYEGFGLVNLYARDFNKKIIVNDNQLNRELFKNCIPDYEGNVFMFKKLSEIPTLIHKINELAEVSENCSQNIRKTSDVAKDTEEFLRKILLTPVNIELLRERWSYFKYLESVHRCYIPQNQNSITFRNFVVCCVKKHPLVYKILKKAKNALIGE
ncbi:glycosyltransferase [Treponema zioleckii]|uniref:glycosyltransferase n=1 Tax=Treponema zioleckii TaxID=331680 RepID=UPI00168BC095|nr:glycosyltransferase [Treponema zioleckii]